MEYVRANAPRAKGPGAFDEITPEIARAGKYGKELDPASVPRELTGYYVILATWQDNTNPEWVRKTVFGEGPAPADEEVARYIETYKQDHKHPDQMDPGQWGISPGQLASWSYYGLREAALELDKAGARVLALEQSRDGLTKQVQELATGVIRVEDLKPGTENTAAVMQLSEAVLRQLGVDPWVEIPLADAIESAPETVESSVTKAVTKYRLNLETAQAEPYTVQETVTEQTPTGQTVKRLKAGTRFDEATGKAYRWVGLSSADAAEQLAALRTAGQIASVQTNMRLAAKFGAPPSGGQKFVAPLSDGQNLVVPPLGGVLSASASAATPANAKPAAR